MPKAAKVTPATINLGTIKTIVTASPKKTGNPERIMNDVADLTALRRIIDDLQDAYAVIETQVREAATDVILTDGCGAKQRPQNFKGCEVEIVDGVSLRHTVSIELRASGSALSEQAQQLADQYHIPVTEKGTQETYIINPEVAANMAIMQALVDVLNAGMAPITAAMQKAGLAGKDILQHQPSSTKKVTTEETLPALFKLDREIAEVLLPLFSTLAVGKCKHAALPGREDDLTLALTRSGKLLGMQDFRAKMQAVSKKKAA